MAARTPRRSFATPFVVTLAAAPACYVQSGSGGTGPSQPPPQPPPTQTSQAQPDQGPPPTVMVNPPRPTPDTATPTPPTQPTQPTQPTPPTPTNPAPQSSTQWTVFKTSDGCQAAVKTECPKGVMCNPPPPIKYACPDNVTLPVTVISRDSGATCAIEFPMPQCPQGAACNPPRPRPVTCPKR